MSRLTERYSIDVDQALAFLGTFRLDKLRIEALKKVRTALLAEPEDIPLLLHVFNREDSQQVASAVLGLTSFPVDLDAEALDVEPSWLKFEKLIYPDSFSEADGPPSPPSSSSST
jgi:hypothetical protein